MKNEAAIVRETKETKIDLSVTLAATAPEVATGLPFLNHMIEAFATHGRFGLKLQATGDLEVDPHHLVEDCGIVLGQAIAEIGEGYAGIARAGFFTFPMDEALATVAIDLCGRPNLVWNVTVGEQPIGGVDLRLFRDFFKGVADGMRATVHASVAYGDNDHHALEAVFKAFGRSLRTALEPVADGVVVSSKGKIDD